MANTTDTTGGQTAGSETEESKRLSSRITDAVKSRLSRGSSDSDGASGTDTDDAQASTSSGQSQNDDSRFQRVRESVNRRREQFSEKKEQVQQAAADRGVTRDRIRRKAEQLQQRQEASSSRGRGNPLAGQRDLSTRTPTAQSQYSPARGTVSDGPDRSVVDRFDSYAADESRDFGDTPINNPLTGNRFESDLRTTSNLAISLSDRLERTVPTPTSVSASGSAAIAERLGFESRADRIRDTEDTISKFKRGIGATVFTTPSEGVATGKEVVETGGALATGDASVDEVGRQVALLTRKTGEQAVNNPANFAGSVAASVGTGAAAGRALGRIGRLGRDRVRTAGSKKLDATDVTNEGTLDYFEGRSSNPDDRFPGAQDPDLYESDPPAAVRQQADDFTPPEVDELFQRAGADDGTTLKKALDVEPEGDRGGFTTQEGDFESPGSFAGPELSPNFLRAGGRSRFSFRPGLPDTGNNPTAVAVRTRVRGSDADTMEGFNQELLDSAGDRTAVTKPSSNVNTGEIEAVIPPESRFVPVESGGRIRNTFRRAGVGSEFRVEIGGRRVPVRTVADPDLLDSDAAPGLRRADADGGPRLDADVGKTLDEYLKRPDTPTDRPAPVYGSAGGTSGAGGPDADTSGGTSRPDSRSTPTRSLNDPIGSGGSGGSGGGSSGGGSGGSGSPPTSPPASSPPTPSDGPVPSLPPSLPPTGSGGSGGSGENFGAPGGGSGQSGGVPRSPGVPDVPSRPRFPDTDAPDDEDERLRFTVSSEKFDTGVVQSLAEYDQRQRDRADDVFDEFGV